MNSQNWVITQDQRGLIYVGSSEGLLVYDDSNWQFTKLYAVLSMAIDSTGRTFVGLENDIGYLKADSKGYL